MCEPPIGRGEAIGQWTNRNENRRSTTHSMVYLWKGVDETKARIVRRSLKKQEKRRAARNGVRENETKQFILRWIVSVRRQRRRLCAGQKDEGTRATRTKPVSELAKQRESRFVVTIWRFSSPCYRWRYKYCRYKLLFHCCRNTA